MILLYVLTVMTHTAFICFYTRMCFKQESVTLKIKSQLILYFDHSKPAHRLFHPVSQFNARSDWPRGVFA